MERIHPELYMLPGGHERLTDRQTDRQTDGQTDKQDESNILRCGGSNDNENNDNNNVISYNKNDNEDYINNKYFNNNDETAGIVIVILQHQGPEGRLMESDVRGLLQVLTRSAINITVNKIDI